MEAALGVLVRSYDYARDLAVSPGDFAVALPTLKGHGAEDVDLRWLLAKGYLHDIRHNGPPQQPTWRAATVTELSPHSAFVLTEPGIAIARRVLVMGGSLTQGDSAKPFWNGENRELHFDGLLVKKFRQPAPTQESILASFKEENWPRHILDPLPPKSGHVTAERLHGAVKHLNGRQKHPVLRFECDGRGQWVIWSPRGPEHRDSADKS